MYLPLAAVVSIAVIGVFLLGRRLMPSAKAGAAAAALAVAVCVGVLGAQTRDRNRVYWRAEGLWQDTVAKRPNDSRARVAYGEALAEAGRPGDAEAQFRAALAMAPDDPAARVRMGAVLAQQGRFDEAVPHLERAVALRPDDPDAHRFLGEVHAVRGRDSLAVRHLEQALVLLPRDARVMGRLAAILSNPRDPSVRNVARARDLAREAVLVTGGRDPRFVELLRQLEEQR
jgi:Flp pilus assembly protein TadD